MKQALITGDQGFLGRHFRADLEDRGWKVWGSDITHTLYPGIHPQGDAMDLFSEDDDVRMDLVIHAAANQPNRAGIDNCHECMARNIKLDAAMFDWAVRTRQKHVLYISSCAVYPRDRTDEMWVANFESRGFVTRLDETEWTIGAESDVYGLTKSIGERMAHQTIKAGTPVTIIRPFSGYGSDQSTDFPFGKFVQRVMAGENPIKIQANVIRDFVHVDDIVNSALHLVENEVVGQPVNICTGRAMYMATLALMLSDAAGHKASVVISDEKTHNIRVGSPTRLHEYYQPQISLEQGVERAIRYARSRKWMIV